VTPGGSGGSGRETCGSCSAALAGDQRYCLACGTRRGPLPGAVAAQVTTLLRRDRGGEEEAPEEEAPVEPSSAVAAWMPTPRTAASLVMVMLALGVILGSVTDHFAQSAGMQAIVVNVPSEGAPAAAVEEPEEAPAEETVVPEAEAAAVPAVLEEGGGETPSGSTGPPPTLPDEPGLPEVRHVFVVMLGENGFEEAFGEGSTAPYLAETLPAKGELLTNYYAVAGGDLANQIALLSGQGPTADTVQDCPRYEDVVPGTVSAEGQVEGNGCVYPAGTETLPSQLGLLGMEWKAYVEDIGNDPSQPAGCRHPAPGGEELRSPVPDDAYLAWRNPFVYFHSIVDAPECAERVVGLDRLAADLESAEAPAFSYIVPDACHDGGQTPCEAGLPAGPAETEPFLREVVPEILASPAYKEGGLIAITSSLAAQGGQAPDSSACCVYPAYPNLSPGPEEALSGPTKASGGGGRVGLLLLSPFVEAGTENASYFNHYTLLSTIEELLGLPKLGYANEEALTPFERTVFNRTE